MLPRCLTAVKDAVDEIVIVDTGSTDRTVEIARSFGARVIEQPWTGSFSDARNTSFDAATSDWVMYLDADEVLVAEDVAKLRAVTGRTWREAFYLVETNYTGESGDGTALTHNALRVFRNRPEYRFEGRLHEQIAHHLPGVRTGTHRADLGPRRALRVSRQREKRARQVTPQHRTAHGPAGRECADAVPALQPRVRVRRRRRRARRARRIRAGLGDDRERPGGRRVRVHAHAGLAARQGATGVRASCGRDRARRRRSAPLPRIHRPRARAGVRVARPRS